MAEDNKDSGPDFGAITQLLNRLNGGDNGAFAQLVKLAYDRVRRIAAWEIKREFDKPPASLTESPTSIADLAIVALEGQRTQWKNSKQFFAIATRLVIRLVVDYRRQRNAARRGGGNRGTSDEQAMANLSVPLLDVDDSILQRLAETLEMLHAEHPLAAEVFTLHHFAELTDLAIAEKLGIELRTVKSQLALAKAWLRNFIANR